MVTERTSDNFAPGSSLSERSGYRGSSAGAAGGSVRSAGRQAAGMSRSADDTISGISAGISDGVEQVGRQARDAARSLASQASDQVMSLADRQVSTGAEVAADIADSIRSAAAGLDERAPQLADLARSAARRVEDFSDSLREQSAAELMRSTAAFARRQPAVVFGAAALGGFLLYRLLSTQADGNTWAGQRSDGLGSDFAGQRQRSGTEDNWNDSERRDAGYETSGGAASSERLEL
jgi:hypothetical protein